MKNVIQKLKSELGGRFSSIQMRDANAKRQESTVETAFIYTSRLTFIEARRRIEILGSRELGCISIFGEFDVQFFSIHSKDQSGFASASIGKVKIGPSDYEVFTKDGVVTNSQRRLLRSTELADLISNLPLRKGEALHFYRNCLVLYTRIEVISSVLVQRMVALASIMPADRDTVGLELPAGFADLVNILKDWGISDDQDRADKIDDASEEDLRRFLAVIEPRMGAIHSYLTDTAEDSVNAAAIANLGSILEATIEARTALVSRTAQNN